MKSYVSMLAAVSLALPLGAFAAAPKHERAMNKPAITMAQAEKTALAKEPGTFKSKELEHEKGRDIYSFDIRAKSGGIHEVNVDANTGAVVEDSVESPAAEAKEKRQDMKQHKAKKPAATGKTSNR